METYLSVLQVMRLTAYFIKNLFVLNQQRSSDSGIPGGCGIKTKCCEVTWIKHMTELDDTGRMQHF